MTNEPPAPLSIDLRLTLEAIRDGLGVLLVGIVAIDFGQPENTAIALTIVVAMAVIQRLLGKKDLDQIKVAGAEVSRLRVENQVLAADAPADVVRQATATSDALAPPVAKKEGEA